MRAGLPARASDQRSHARRAAAAVRTCAQSACPRAAPAAMLERCVAQGSTDVTRRAHPQPPSPLRMVSAAALGSSAFLQKRVTRTEARERCRHGLGTERCGSGEGRSGSGPTRVCCRVRSFPSTEYTNVIVGGSNMRPNERGTMAAMPHPARHRRCARPPARMWTVEFHFEILPLNST